MLSRKEEILLLITINWKHIWGMNYIMVPNKLTKLTKDLEGSFCIVYLDNFFNSPILSEKLFDKNIYAIGTVRKNRKQLPKMLEDKKIKVGDCKFLYSKNVMACKWMDNRSVLLLSSAIEGIDDVSSVQRREKGSATKSAIPCPTVVKLYNSGMGGVNLMDQRIAAYQLDRKSSVRFYLRFFFWFVRFYLRQQVSRIQHGASESINIARLQNRHS